MLWGPLLCFLFFWQIRCIPWSLPSRWDMPKSPDVRTGDAWSEVWGGNVPFLANSPQMCGQMDTNPYHCGDLIKWWFWSCYYIQSSKHNKPYLWLNETEFLRKFETLDLFSWLGASPILKTITHKRPVFFSIDLLQLMYYNL